MSSLVLEGVVFTWNQSNEVWSGRLTLGARKAVRIIIYGKESKGIDEAVKAQACRTIQDISAIDLKWKDLICAGLYEQYAENWAKDKALDQNAFISELQISEIAIDYDQDYWAYYDADLLFDGHCVVVITSENFELKRVDIRG